MTDKKISQLSNATTPLAGTEVLPIVQSGSTVKVSVANLTAGRTVDATTVNATTVDATNVEVTNVKAKDGTSAITIADSTGVVTASANPILNAGTANGVVYLDANKVATSGSAVTFDGTNLATTGTATATKLVPTGNVTAGNGMFLPTANAVGISTNGVERVRVSSAGRVSVGTTNTANLFQLAAAIGISNSSAMASNGTEGDFTVSVSNLTEVTGALYRRCALLVFYSGIDTGSGNSTTFLSIVTLTGLSTYGATVAANIVGTASISTANATGSSLDITFDVPDTNFGSVFVTLLGGFTGTPSISIAD